MEISVFMFTQNDFIFITVNTVLLCAPLPRLEVKCSTFSLQLKLVRILDGGEYLLKELKWLM